MTLAPYPYGGSEISKTWLLQFGKMAHFTVWEDEDYSVSDCLDHTSCLTAAVAENEDQLLSLSRADKLRVLHYLESILSNN
jgi:hypothetical protein